MYSLNTGTTRLSYATLSKPNVELLYLATYAENQPKTSALYKWSQRVLSGIEL